MRHTHIFLTVAMLTAFFSSISLNAQLVKISIPDKVLMSSYIFEGEVIRKDSYYNQNQDFIYTSYTIDISKIFKGDINCGTIEIISEGGEMAGESLLISHNLDLENGDVGTFMCIPTNREASAIDFYPETNNLTLEIYGESQGFLRYQVTDSVIRATDAFYSFDSLALVYDMLEFYSQLNYTNCNPTIVHELQDQIPKQRKKSIIGNSTPSEQYKQALKNLELKRNYANQNVESQLNKTQTNILYYTFENVAINVASQTLDFDIYLFADDNTTYFDGGWIEIPLEPYEFGTDLVATNRVTVTRGTILANTTNYSDPLPLDGGIVPSAILAISFGAKWDPAGRYNLTTTPTQAMHVTINLLNCAVPLNFLTFSNYPSVFQNSFYAINANDLTANTINYPNVDISDTDNASCYPEVSSIYPTTVSGGIGDYLIIKGKYFGTVQGEVSLKNANDGGLSDVKLDASDITLGGWTDTLILLTVPATAQSGKVVGSGRVKVKQAGVNGKANTSINDLNVLYNLHDYLSGGKFYLPLRNAQGNGNYEFYIDNEISNNLNMYKTTAKAMWQWNCKTGVDFKMGPTYTWLANTTLENDTSQIIVGTLPAGVIMRTITRAYDCPNQEKYVKEIDIIFSRDYVTLNNYLIDTTGTQDVPAGKVDFYTAILHEFGHAVGENHVLDKTSIMYYANENDSLIGIPDSNRLISIFTDISASQGGIKSIALSQSNVASCVSIITPAFPVNCGTNPIHDETEYSIIQNLYPNPANSYLNIEIDMPNPIPLKVQIYNSMGQLIRQEQFNTIQSQIFTTSISNLVQGIYTLSIQTPNYIYTQKFIKE